MDVRSKLNSRIVLHDCCIINVSRIDEFKILAEADIDTSFLKRRTSGLRHKSLDSSIVVQALRKAILSTIEGLKITLLKCKVDNRALRNFGHENILKDALNPLLLKEERVIRNDRSITDKGSFCCNRIKGVLEELLNTVSIVIIERRVRASRAREQRGSRQGLSNVTNEIFLSRRGSDDITHVLRKIDTLSRIRFKNMLNFRLKASAAIGSIVIANNIVDLLIRKCSHIN